MILLLVGVLVFIFLPCLLIGIGTAPTSRQFPCIIPPPLPDVEGIINGRPWRRDNEGNPIYGYQPRLDSNRSVPTLNQLLLDMDGEPVPGGNVRYGFTTQEVYDGLMMIQAAAPSMSDFREPPATVKDAPHEASSWEMSL